MPSRVAPSITVLVLPKRPSVSRAGAETGAPVLTGGVRGRSSSIFSRAHGHGWIATMKEAPPMQIAEKAPSILVKTLRPEPAL